MFYMHFFVNFLCVFCVLILRTKSTYRLFEMYHKLSSSDSSGNDVHYETFDIADDVSMVGNDFGTNDFIPSSTPMAMPKIMLNGNGKRAADHDLSGATFKIPRPVTNSNYLSKNINKNSETWNNSTVTSNLNTNSVISNNNFIPNGNLTSTLEHAQLSKTVPPLSYSFHIPPPNYVAPPLPIQLPPQNYVPPPPPPPIQIPPQNYVPPQPIHGSIPERANGISNPTFKPQQDNKNLEMDVFRNVEPIPDQKSLNRLVKGIVSYRDSTTTSQFIKICL